MKKSDLLDRWTILRMKARFDTAAQQELAAYDDALFRIDNPEIKQHEWVDLVPSLLKLMEANAKIWVLESSIRQEYDKDPLSQNKLTLEEVGRRALEIRNTNRLRCEARQVIDLYFRELPDLKVNHQSDGQLK